MGTFVVNTEQEQKQMLAAAGKSSFDALFATVPDSVKIDHLNLPEGMSELETAARMEGMAAQNTVYRQIFRGAGAYHHYIPAVVKRVTGKEEFLTAYTPYQAEISQGVLQSIFEYQTMICELTGLDCANASVYDGATAAAEAVKMCVEKKRTKILVAQTAQPETVSVIRTYAFGKDDPVQMIAEKDGVLDPEALKAALAEDSACLFVQQPNYYGNLEDMDAIAAMVKEAGAKLVMGCNPVSLGLLKTPGAYGADIACGEGQPLGLPLGFGGPYLGFMACTEKMMRKLPGRIIGETKDHDGNKAYVLTLQAREQHIRREKAGSNICSNEALCALTAAVYLSAMGPEGLKEVAKQCSSKAHYLQKVLAEAGLQARDAKPFFHEFVTVSETPSSKILEALREKGILGGLPLNEKEILWCATELNTRQAMDEVAEIVKEVRA
ncbi:MAG: aminomethyl-transferring glycine dehydrogenase subunit GcvPA [Lachnospiraceae bacterium]|nr:aminomethyl-transferring glycine dehydrogenase subunit GcvPA [Lachnospiraceae bacterium]